MQQAGNGQSLKLPMHTDHIRMTPSCIPALATDECDSAPCCCLMLLG